MRTEHPSVQLEEKRQASKPAANEGASLSTATVAAAAASTVCSSPPQPPGPTTQSATTQFVQKAMYFKMCFF